MSVFGRENKKRCLKGVTSVLLGFLVALLLLLLVAIHPWWNSSVASFVILFHDFRSWILPHQLWILNQ